MSGSVQRGFCVLLVSAAAGFGVWKYGAGSSLDRAAFGVVAGGFVNPPLFVERKGTHAEPWTLRTFSNEAKPGRKDAPLVVSLGDDVGGFFQSSPMSPVDFAVVLKNFHRLGAKKVATAAVFSWEKPDAVEYVALERSLAAFDSLVTTAPLSYGPVSDMPLPQEFRRASLPVDAVSGKGFLRLPVVNRIPLSGVILGGEKAMAGFSILESEQRSRFLHLIARWKSLGDDRLLFSTALLAVMQRLELPLSGMEIRPGEYLKLGPDGPIVPMDDYGRLSIPLRSLPGYAEIPAEEVIDGGEELFPKDALLPVVLRDDRTAAEPATQAFSKTLSAAIANLSSREGLAPSRVYPRLPQEWETGILGGVVLLLAMLGAAGDSKRHVGALVLAGLFLAAQWIAFGMASVWMPGIPVLAAIASAVVVARFTGRGKKPTSPIPVDSQELAPQMVTPELVTESEPEPGPVPEKPAPKTSSKPPAKKAAKKPAPPKTPRTKKPPSKS